MNSVTDYAFVIWLVATVIMAYYTIVFRIANKVNFWLVIIATAVVSVATLIGTLCPTGRIAYLYQRGLDIALQYPSTFIYVIQATIFCCLLMFLVAEARKP